MKYKIQKVPNHSHRGLNSQGVSAESDPLSLHRDQTIPQTVSGGAPIFEDGLNMSNSQISNVGYVQMDLSISRAIAEGEFQWDSDAGTLLIGMPGGNVALNAGQENHMPDRPKNVSGAQIDNGEAVYLSGASGAVPEMSLASAAETSGPKMLAIATEDIAASQRGYYTTFGVVRDIDTSFGSDGDEVFLGVTPGSLTTTKLDHPNFRIKVGYIIRSHATEGVLLVSISPEQWLKRFQAIGEPTGFDRKHSDLIGDMSFTDGTRTFQIDKKAGQDYYTFWINAKEYRKASAESVVITDTEGLWFIYYNSSGVLTASQTPWSFGSDVAFVALVYWDATNNKGKLYDERHGITMDWADHQHWHLSFGALYYSGLTPSITADGSGSLDASCEMSSISAGSFGDEDIPHENSQQTTYEKWYRDGANGYWRWGTASAALVDMGATYPYYNEWTGSTWQRTELGANKFGLMFGFADNRYGASDRVIMVMGQDEYNSKSDAQEAILTAIKRLQIDGLATPEIIPLFAVIIGTSPAYTNSYKAIVISTVQSNDYFDLRGISGRGSGGSGSAGDYVEGPASSVDSNLAMFDGTSGLLIKDSGYTTDQSVSTTSNVEHNKLDVTTSIAVGDASHINNRLIRAEKTALNQTAALRVIPNESATTLSFTASVTDQSVGSWVKCYKMVGSTYTDSGYQFGQQGTVFRNFDASFNDSGTLATINTAYWQFGHSDKYASATPVTNSINGFRLTPYMLTGSASALYTLRLDAIVGSGTVTTYRPIYQVDTNGENYFGADSYFVGDVSALTFTDRTPFFEGDAITEIKKIKGKDGEIDHSTLPMFVRKKKTMLKLKEKKEIDPDKEHVDEFEPAEEIELRDIGAMVSVLTVAVQQLTDRIEKLEAK